MQIGELTQQILAVQRMQDYIAEHLSEEITPSNLATASMFSPWYSYRLFMQYVNMTPSDYIRRFRLSLSALKLRDECCKITDIAFEMGFGSIDGYRRAFYREFGCNPREYAKNPIPIYLFTPYGVKYQTERKEYVMDNNLRNVFIQEVIKPRRKAIIKRGIKADNYFDYCDEVGCDIWGLLRSIFSISNEPVSMWLPKEYVLPNTSIYVQGTEVGLDYDGIIPDGLDLIELPETKYLLFRGEPFKEEDYCQAIEEIWEAEKKYDPSFLGYEWDDKNPRIQLEPIGERGYMELVPVK